MLSPGRTATEKHLGNADLNSPTVPTDGFISTIKGWLRDLSGTVSSSDRKRRVRAQGKTG